ncbi:hypothetical protein ES288_A11G249800v1 [Gossypium darwinii]|uniref:Uncharacterized protein n=1 Tax=Gossypium darwinii TaxID=34276 RepID=A0A5D2ENG5_GOSDA|nr:hypothetical protein ES288_A11G249800v1 [Gossypium darwinii]
MAPAIFSKSNNLYIHLYNLSKKTFCSLRHHCHLSLRCKEEKKGFSDRQVVFFMDV